MYVLEEGMTWLSNTWKLCQPLKSKENVKELKDYLINVWTNLAMIDYPYPADFLAPVPAYPIKVSFYYVFFSLIFFFSLFIYHVFPVYYYCFAHKKQQVFIIKCSTEINFAATSEMFQWIKRCSHWDKSTDELLQLSV